MQLSNREKILLSLLGVAAILGLGIRFMIMPALEKHEIAQQELIIAQDEQIRISGLLAQESGLEEKKGEALASAGRLGNSYFERVLPEQVDYWLNQLEKKTGVIYSVVGISEEKVLTPEMYSSLQPELNLPLWEYYNQFGKNPQEIKVPLAIEEPELAEGEAVVIDDLVIATTLDLKLEGTYSQVMKLLDRLSDGEKRVDVNSFGMVPEAEEEVIDFIFHPPTEENGEVIMEEITRAIHTGRMNVTMKMTIYSIPKDYDGSLDYKIPMPSGQETIM